LEVIQFLQRSIQYTLSENISFPTSKEENSQETTSGEYNQDGQALEQALELLCSPFCSIWFSRPVRQKHTLTFGVIVNK